MALVSMSIIGTSSMNDTSDRQPPRKPAKSRTGLQNGREVVTGSKRNVIQSSSFMDALGGSTTEKEKKRPRMVNEKKKRRLSEEDLLGGIYNKMNKMHETSSTMDYSSGTHGNGPKSPPEVKTNAPISPPPPERVPKIRFADDHGRPLVDVRYFEVEEGERVNVNTLTHEQIRAMEVQMEKKALGKHGAAAPAKSGMKQEFPEDDPMEGNTADEMGNIENRWRVIEVSNIPTRGYGTKSVEAKNETRRQQSALEAFYMPGRGVTRFEEPPLVDARATDRHRPKTIPLACPVQQPVATTAAATPASTSSSQSTTPAAIPNVVNGLRGDGDAVGETIATTATTAATVPATPLASILPERSKVMDLLSKLKSKGILQGSPMAAQSTQPLQQQAAPPMIAPIYSQPAQPTYQQEFYLPPVTATSSTMPSMSSTVSHPIQQSVISNYHQSSANVYARALPTIPQASLTQHSYVATMPPQPVTPHFSSQSAPALPVSATFNQMPIVVPPAPRNIEQAHHHHGGGVGHFERPAIKPRGPFNGPVMGGYRQCRTYGTATGCSFGDRCRYAHGDQPPPAAAGVRRNAAKNEATIAGSVGARMGL